MITKCRLPEVNSKPWRLIIAESRNGAAEGSNPLHVATMRVSAGLKPMGVPPSLQSPATPCSITNSVAPWDHLMNNLRALDNYESRAITKLSGMFSQ